MHSEHAGQPPPPGLHPGQIVTALVARWHGARAPGQAGAEDPVPVRTVPSRAWMLTLRKAMTQAEGGVEAGPGIQVQLTALGPGRGSRLPGVSRRDQADPFSTQGQHTHGWPGLREHPAGRDGAEGGARGQVGEKLKCREVAGGVLSQQAAMPAHRFQEPPPLVQRAPARKARAGAPSWTPSTDRSRVQGGQGLRVLGARAAGV